MTEELKIKIYLHYMVKMVGLNFYRYEVSINSKGVDEKKCKNYPLLGVKTFVLDRKHKILDYKDFIENRMDDYYWKFKQEIDKS